METVFADRHPEVKDILAKGAGKYGGQRYRRKDGVSYRVSIGWSVVSDLITRSGGFDDITLHCINLYMNNPTLRGRDVNEICIEMKKKRLEEGQDAVVYRVS